MGVTIHYRGQLNDTGLLPSLSDLEVSDESEYWETGDRRKLEEVMSLLNRKLQHLCGAISSGSMGHLAGLSGDEIASRIEQLFPKGEDGGAEPQAGPDKA
jgi:hypothetical protein